MKLQVLPLSQEAFSAYGDVIETQQRDFFHINNGLVERYHDLPLTIHELERHPLGTQAFIPMKGEVFVVVVALGDDKPDLSTLRAFITNGEQGVNYHRNVWHHPLFAWQRVTDFLTIDRGGSDNCDVESIPEQELCFA